MDQENTQLRLPSDIINEINERDDTEFPLCNYHNERYKHFFCPEDWGLYCRACLNEGL